MPETLGPSRETSAFFARVVQASRSKSIDWKEEPAGGNRVQFRAALGEYHLLLRKVPDLDGMTDDPDVILDVITGETRLLTLNRNNVLNSELEANLNEPVPYAYVLFEELWEAASLKATNLHEHLSRLQHLLNEQKRG